MIPYITCSRSGETVSLSSSPTYPFTNTSLDEDLFFFETKLNTSLTSKEEAKDLFLKKAIPSNFSNDKQLQLFVSNYLKHKTLDLSSFKELDVLKSKELEYDEAVLLSILWI